MLPTDGRSVLRRLATAAACLAFTLVSGQALAGSLSGTFVEGRGGAPLAAVEVVVRRPADSTVVAHTTTDEQGRFRLAGLEPGRYLLRASLLGHASLERSDLALTATAQDVDLGTQALAILPVAVEGVTSSSARATAIIAPDRNIYLTKDMPAATSGTATDLLRAVPELDVDINGRVSLRGSSSVTIQVNGRPTPLTGEALDTYLRQFPANRIERIEVIANPSARFNPEGMAGIVNIVLKEGVDLGLSGSLNLSGGTNSASPGARIAWQKGPVTLFGGLSGWWNRNRASYGVKRVNLLAQPLTYYEVDTGNEYRSGAGMSDASVDLALDKRATLYATFNGYLNSFRWDGVSHYAVLDEARAPTTRYDLANHGENEGRTGTVTAGFRHVVKQGRDERTIELRQSDSHQDNLGRTEQHVFVPADSAGPSSRLDGAFGSRERSLEADDTHPLGEKGKLEVGYRGSERRNANSRILQYFEDGEVVVTPQSSASDYEHREVFHSGYLTAGSTFGRASVQLGVRAEAANTTFDVRRTRTRYRNDYRSVFPSANVAWDFGRGVTTRLSYSKRIERPAAWYLNPEVPTTDPLSRMAGNPYLKPKYTHSFSLEGSWAGSRGSLRVSPYYRRTVDNWDQYVIVDSSGAATTTWLNASSIDFLGASVTASLRQAGRLGGTVSLNVYRESHDATNLSSASERAATNWSANGNLTYKLFEPLDVQVWARYNPAQTLAQGRIAATALANLGARLKLGKQASVGLWVNDPFDWWKYEFSTHDAAHTQTTTNRYTIRSASLNVSWSWGKPPEQKPRKQSEQSPQQEPMTPTP